MRLFGMQPLSPFRPHTTWIGLVCVGRFRSIVGWCNIPTALVEVGVILAVFYVKSVVY